MSSAGSGSSNEVKLTFSPEASVTLTFESIEGTEELGRPFLYELQMSSEKACPDTSTWLGSSVTVEYSKDKSTKNYFNGILTRAVYAGLVAGAYRYRVELRPWFWLLTRKQDCKIFQNKSAYDIITGIFSDAGFSGSFSDGRKNSAGSTVLEFCVQYNETSFDFVTRLMEIWGLYYYIAHADGSHTLWICDDPGSHPAIPGDAIPFAFKQTDYRQTVDHIWEWLSELRLHSGAYTVTDYNFTTPAADLTGKSTTADTSQHPYSDYEIFSYPGTNETAAVGQTLATVRMQDLTVRGSVYRGTTNSRGIYTGCSFTMSKHVEDSLNQPYIVIRATHSLQAAAGKKGDSDSGGDLVDAMKTTFMAIASTTNFQLPRLTPRPIVRGPQTAKVVGASGDEITTDSYGRVKCQFFWDRYSTQDENSSCWIRVSQGWAGLSWGSMFIPRIGQEVIVEFLEGNPDRPIITGRVYNATQTVPYTLPDNATQSTMKSNSSKGGNGYNEIRFEDKAGSEEVYFQAQKDYNKVVLNNETVKIKQDTTTTVQQGNRAITVSQGNDSTTISQGNHSMTVSTGNSSTTVTSGNYTIDVTGGSSTITVGQSLTLKVGPSSITIDTSGIKLAGPQISITADASASIDGGGSLSLTGGMISIN